MPALALQASGGFLLVSLADVAARADQQWAMGMFYAGLLLLYLPVILAILVKDLTRSEHIGAIIILGVGMLLCEAVAYPLGPASFDEMLHARTAEDILVNGRLFDPNALLPVSPFYPGLENVTSALQSLSGLALWPASIIVLGVARVLLMLAIFLLIGAVAASSTATGSSTAADWARVGSLGAVIYAANPRFLYFDAQYAYESLGLPLAAFVLAAIATRLRETSTRTETIAICVVVVACVVTHPVTSAMLSIFLLAWTVIRFALDRWYRGAEAGPSPWWPTAACIIAMVGWAILVAPTVIRYLGPPLTRAGDQILQLISGDAETRTLFQAASGEGASIWEQALGYGSVGIVVLLIPFGIRRMWLDHRRSPLAWTLALVAVAYPFGVVGRLSPLGADIAARTPEFLFLGIGACLAIVLARWLGPAWRASTRLGLTLAAATVVLIGGVIVGIPNWARLPGPYLVAADVRSIEPNGIAAATWTREYLGVDRRMVTDRTNRLLMGVYGHQEIAYANEPRANLGDFYQSLEFGPGERELVEFGRVQYAVIDERLTSALPTVGYYFQKQELTEGGGWTAPLRSPGLKKFDVEPGLDRVFDDGDLRIYDVSSLGRRTAR